tara:strand:- start:366 stop:587 length:222 start_codon:yes stop_codon:yes gene_type:complete
MSLVLRLPLVQTEIRPELVRPACDFFRQVSLEKRDLSNHREVNFLIFREPLDVTFTFLRNKRKSGTSLIKLER